MLFTAAKCPNCAGDLQVPEDRDSVKCMYCGSDIIVREAIKAAAASVNIENLFNLAKSAFDAGNFQEARDYYTRVLEVDEQNYEAWLGKGFSSGWLSTLAVFRLPETITALGKAIEYAPEDKKDEIKNLGILQITEIILAYNKLSLEEYYKCIKFVDVSLAFDESAELVEHRLKMISALEQAHTLFPDDKFLIEQIIVFCDIAYNGKKEISMFCLTKDEYEKALKTKREFYVSKMKSIDPSYVDTLSQLENEQEQVIKLPDPPKINEEKSNCFIATATMGSVNNPTVVLLREFRDTWLLKRKFGQIFIDFYYKKGPYIATIINKYPSLKRITYQVSIRPTACLARLLLRK